MSRKLALSLLILAHFAVSQAHAVRPSGNVSEVLPRLQRDAQGNILAREPAASNSTPRPSGGGPRRQAQQFTADAWKRGAGKFSPSDYKQGAPKVSTPDPKRLAGQQSPDAWKRGAGKFSPSDYKKGAPKVSTPDPKRLAGKQSPDAWKRGAGKFSPVNPPSKSPAAPRTAKSAPKSTPKSGGALKKAGAIGAVVGGGALIGDSLSQAKSLKQARQSGKVTELQYRKGQATQGVNLAGEAMKLKKLNPSSIALGATIGTDPISLGMDVAGDLINGTSNTKETFKRVGKKLDQHGKAAEKLVTNPKGWAEDRAKSIDKGVKKVGKGVKDAGKLVGGIFKKKKK